MKGEFVLDKTTFVILRNLLDSSVLGDLSRGTIGNSLFNLSRLFGLFESMNKLKGKPALQGIR